MKSFIKNSAVLFSGILLLAACDPKIDAPTPTADGNIDMTKYIAIGNSLTAGYASNGLFLEGQKVAYPILIAQQFKLAGGGAFTAPLFTEDQKDGTGYLKLTGFSPFGTPILSSVPLTPNIIGGKTAEAYDINSNPDSVFFKPFEGTGNQNWGVPGIKIADINKPNYGWLNPYYGRLIAKEEKSTLTYAQKMTSLDPTFFSCWLGNNDVLGYSTSGGAEILANVTPPAEFDLAYRNFINGMLLKPNPPKGVLSNIPDVTSIPFFTTVGPSIKMKLQKAEKTQFFEYDFTNELLVKVATIVAFISQGQLSPVSIIDPTKVTALPRSGISTLNSVTKKWDGDIYFTLTFSPYVGQLDSARGTAWRDIIKTLMKRYGLPSVLEPKIWEASGLDTTKPFGFDAKNPIPDVFILNPTETAKAKATVDAFNRTIESIATQKGLAFVNANEFLGEITKGSYFDAISANASFLSGGVFSLDGVHLTPRGNAIGANEFIKAINKKYGTKITVLNAGQYKGVSFP